MKWLEDATFERTIHVKKYGSSEKKIIYTDAEGNGGLGGTLVDGDKRESFFVKSKHPNMSIQFYETE